MAQRKILVFEMAELGDTARDLISMGQKLKVVKYATGEALPEGIMPIKMELVFTKSQIHITAEHPSFPDVPTPPQVAAKVLDAEESGIEVVP